MTTNIEQALTTLPDLRARVDADDDYLRNVIRGFERVLGELRPVPLDLIYEVEGLPRHILLQQSRDMRWHVAWRGNACDSIPLLSASREVRAEVFTPTRWVGDTSYDTPIAPIETLVIEVMRELSRVVIDRGPSMEVAQRLEASIGALISRLRGGMDHATIR